MQVLTDAQWAKFEAAIAAVKIRGARPRVEDRRTIEAIIRRLDNGAKWRSIPSELCDWHHAYLRFRRWAERFGCDELALRLLDRASGQGIAQRDGDHPLEVHDLPGPRYPRPGPFERPQWSRRDDPAIDPQDCRRNHGEVLARRVGLPDA